MLQKNMKVNKKIPKIRVKKRLAKKKAVLSNRVKKIFDGDKKSLDIVMFEENRFGGLHHIPVGTSYNSSVGVNIAEHPLDQYSSPYLLDLSKKRYIERVKPTLDGSFQVSYQDLPAGEILEKLQIFQLLALNNSEILNWLKYGWSKFTWLVKKPFQRIDFSPKLPLAKKKAKANQGFDIWQEISIINFLFFISSKISWLFNLGWRLVSHLYANLVGQYIGRDEVVVLETKKVIAIEKNPLPTSQTNSLVNKRFRINLPPINFSGLIKSFELSQLSLKPLLAFSVVALLIVIPIRLYFYLESAKETKGQVLGQAEEALNSLTSAQSALADFKFSEAQSYLSAANNDFISAQKQLAEIKSFLTILAEILPLNNTYRSGKNLIDLGEKLTKAGEFIVAGLNQFTGESDLSLSSRVKNFQVDTKEALRQMESAEENVSKIKISHLPAENQDKFVELKDNLPMFIASLKKSDNLMGFITNFLGEQGLKRYLIVFQNDNELRATGGFMGSVALVDFKNGNIENIEIPSGGTYDFKAGLTKLWQSPEPLRLVNQRWEFQDANWWPDWPTSAKNISYFYNDSAGATIDGVIAINSDWLGSLLAVIGPIEMPDYQKTIKATNFEMELQQSIEVEAQDKTQPKKILSDLAPKLIEKILAIAPDQMLSLASALNQGLAEKDILVYLADENEQKFVAENNWDGRLKDTGQDYLNVVVTNIGGGKTDSAIRQEIYHQASIAEDGSIIDNVVINRSHFGPLDGNFTNLPNRSYIRVYVPLGSELLKAQGFKHPADNEFKPVDDYLKENPALLNEKAALIDKETSTKIYNEDGKTVFANWLTVAPGDDREVLLVYKLPFGLNLNREENKSDGLLDKIKAAFFNRLTYNSYSLLVQKQPGSDDDYFVSQVEYPSGLSSQITYPSYPGAVENNAQESIYRDKLTHDLFYFIGFQY